MGTLRIAPNEYMRIAIYDKDESGIADKTEAIREVDTLPEIVKAGEVLLLKSDGHYYVGVKT